MWRSLAPAGHRIEWKDVLKATISSLAKRETQFDLFETDEETKYMLFNSGTAALFFLCSHLKSLSDKNEVIIPAYTCPQVAAAIIKAGLTPVLCDINKEDFSLNFEDVKNKLNKNTLAIIQVELFGIIPDIRHLVELSHQFQFHLIGDIAQSLGNYIIQKDLIKIQRYDYLVFSLGRGKPLNLLHGGGIVFRADKKSVPEISQDQISNFSIWENILLYLNIFLYIIFFHPNFYKIPRSLPFLKLGETDFDLNFKVKKISPFIYHLAQILAGRFFEIQSIHLRNAKKYSELLKKYEKHLIQFKNEKIWDLLRYPVLIDDPLKRNQVLKELNCYGIGATRLYPASLDSQNGLENFSLHRCKSAQEVSQRILTLPLHEHVNQKDFLRVKKVFDEILT